MILGTTVSHRQLKYLDCDVNTSLQLACEMGFEYLRLGLYWDEVEKESGVFDWDVMEHLLTFCQKQNQEIVLTIGCKAPRYPEFYFPDWVEKKNSDDLETQGLLLNFIKKAIEQFDSFECIAYWQVENEPLDPVWPHQLSISTDFLREEVKLTRSLSSKKVIINDWGNDLSSRGTLEIAEQLSDVVGVDLYYKQHIKAVLGKSIYSGPRDSDETLSKMFTACEKPIWLIELQAEPWEKNENEYRKPITGSISPELLKNYFHRAANLPVEAIFFWGFEWWVYQAKQGNSSYLDIVSEIISS